MQIIKQQSHAHQDPTHPPDFHLLHSHTSSTQLVVSLLRQGDHVSLVSSRKATDSSEKYLVMNMLCLAHTPRIHFHGGSTNMQSHNETSIHKQWEQGGSEGAPIKIPTVSRAHA